MSEEPLALPGVPVLPTGYKYEVEETEGLIGGYIQVRIVLAQPYTTCAIGTALGLLHRPNAKKQVAKAAQRAYRSFEDYLKASQFEKGITWLGMAHA